MSHARNVVMGGVMALSAIGLSCSSVKAQADPDDGNAPAATSKWKGPDTSYFEALRADMEKVGVPYARMAAQAAFCDEAKLSNDLMERSYDKNYAVAYDHVNQLPLLQALTVDSEKLSADFAQWLLGFKAGSADAAAERLKAMKADEKSDFCKKAVSTAQDALKQE